MRVLWIAPNGGCYKNNEVKGTGGWISALEEEITKKKDIELAIAFNNHNDTDKLVSNNVTYYPINRYNGRRFLRYWRFFVWSDKKLIEHNVNLLLKAIQDFEPDIVHVWGLEDAYSSVIPYIKCPFLVHIQGIINPILFKYLPNGFSDHDLKAMEPWWNPKYWVRHTLRVTDYHQYKKFRKSASREKILAKYVKNWVGRTDWDRITSQMLSPGSSYYHCDEFIRKDFLSSRWEFHYDGKVLKIHSSIGAAWYKGLDLILNTAKILRDYGVLIEWNVYGVANNTPIVNYFEKKLKLDSSSLGVNFYGRVNGDEIKKGLLYCDVFVHPSIIENSSNAIAEAMLLGVPTIAQYVGGNPSMLRDSSGIIVAENEPYTLANAILGMRELKTATMYSEKAYSVASQRHNNEKNIESLIDIYKSIINK